jgi:hypothetical protein
VDALMPHTNCAYCSRVSLKAFYLCVLLKHFFFLLCLYHHVMQEREGTAQAYSTRALKAIAAMSKWFASTPIRSVAAVAGNIATASPISGTVHDIYVY